MNVVVLAVAVILAHGSTLPVHLFLSPPLLVLLRGGHVALRALRRPQGQALCREEEEEEEEGQEPSEKRQQLYEEILTSHNEVITEKWLYTT